MLALKGPKLVDVNTRKAAPYDGTTPCRNPMAERFCNEFLIDLKVTKAAERCGLQKNYGYVLFNSYAVQKRLKHLMDKRCKAMRLDACYVVENLKEIAAHAMEPVPVYRSAGGKLVQVDTAMRDARLAKDTLELLAKHRDIDAFRQDEKAQQQPFVLQIGVRTG